MRDGFREIVEGWTLIDDWNELTERIERLATWAMQHAPLEDDEAATARLMIESQLATAPPADRASDAAKAEWSRSAHIEWCKDRALEYWQRGDLASAVASMGSDLPKHPGCKVILMELAMLHVIQHDADGVRRWITGFR